MRLRVIRIHIIGFGWQDLHHPWSKEGHTYTANELLQYLTEKLIPEQTHRGIPTSPTMNMPSRKVTPQLGKRTADVAELEERYENEKQKAVEEAIKLRDQLEDEGIIDRHERLQPTRPEVNEDLIGAKLEILYSYVEPDGSNKNMWCQGVVVAGIKFILNGMPVPSVMVMNLLLRRHCRNQSTTSMLLVVGGIV